MRSFKTNNVIVRKFRMDDIEQVQENISIYNDINDMENSRIYKSINLNEARMIIKSAINEYYTDEPVWAVEDKKSKKLVGFIRVANYSQKHKRCNITWIMSYQYCDVLFMKEALSKIIRFLFSKKNIELIECSYYGNDNGKNSINSEILESIGMQKEAVLRDRRINEETNEKENFVIYSINKDEFYEFYNRKEKCYKS